VAPYIHLVRLSLDSAVPYESSLPCSVVLSRRGGVRPRAHAMRDGCPLRPGGVSRVCLSLSGLAYFIASGLSLSFLRGQDEGEVERGCVACNGRKEMSWWTALLGIWPGAYMA
jgi:hypothetical protein